MVELSPSLPEGVGMGWLCGLGWILDLDKQVGHGRYHRDGVVPPVWGLGGVGVWL